MKKNIPRGLAAVCACALGAQVLLADAADVPGSASAEHQAAVWKEQHYSFAYLGFTTTYSCDGLADKLKVLLLAAGARPDAKSRSGACTGGFGTPDKFARAELDFYTLVPAGADAATGTAIDGIWRHVAFAAHKPRELTAGDCELMDQFKSNVLPLFTVRNVEEHTTCVPNQLSGSNIDLKFDSLAGVITPVRRQINSPKP